MGRSIVAIKIVLLVAALSAQLSASNNFWQQLEDLEQKFYITLDQNLTDINNSLESTQSLNLRAKYDAFNALANTLKSQYFEIKQSGKQFYSAQDAQKELFTLNARIVINKKNGYSAAVLRDTIAMRSLKLKQQIYNFSLALSKNWIQMSKDEIQNKIQQELNTLNELSVQDLYEKEAQSSKLSQKIKSMKDNLHREYQLYKDFLKYLQLNSSIFDNTSLVQNLQLATLIGAINNNALAASINNYLRYIKLDIGRLVLFILVLFLALVTSRLIYKYAYNFLRVQIHKKSDETDEMMSANIEKIRKPLSFLIVTFGLELAIEVITYPSAYEKNSIFFYAIYLVTISYIVVILIDNLVFHYLLKKAVSKNRQLRSELINLLVSILKAVVFIVALLLLLVKLDVNITGILASLGIGGLAIALAAKDTLSNFFGLIKIIADNSMSQGDWIQANDIEGTVVEIGFVSTDIRTFDNALITVPNSMLANVALKNWNRRSVGRRIKMYIGVSYNADPQKLNSAIDAIRQMLHDHNGIVAPQKYDPSALKELKKHDRKLVSFEDKHGIKTTMLVYLDRLSDSSIDILIYVFTNTVNWQEWLEIKQDVIFRIWKIIENHDLEIAFPSQTIYFDKQNAKESFGT